MVRKIQNNKDHRDNLSMEKKKSRKKIMRKFRKRTENLRKWAPKIFKRRKLPMSKKNINRKINIKIVFNAKKKTKIIMIHNNLLINVSKSKRSQS